MGADEQESTLFAEIRAGNPAALDRVIEENQGLVYTAIKRFLNRGQAREDLIQIGSVGLIKAAQRFDETKGCAFSTYAFALIIGELKQFFRDDGMIKVSREWKQTAARAGKAAAAWEQEHGSRPTPSQLAALLGITPEELTMVLDAAAPPGSLEAACEQGTVPSEEGFSAGLIEQINLEDALKKLLPEEEKLIILRYFRQLSQGLTGQLMGMTQPQVSRTEKKILQKLKKFL